MNKNYLIILLAISIVNNTFSQCINSFSGPVSSEYLPGYDGPFTNGPEASVWYGPRIALVVDDESSPNNRDANAMALMTEDLGEILNLYDYVVGRTPPAGTPLKGRPGIEVSNSVGGGLASHGTLGVGINKDIWEQTYNNYLNGNRVLDQIYYYELQRNYWFSDMNPTIDHKTSDGTAGFWTVGFNNFMAAIAYKHIPSVTDLNYFGMNGQQFFDNTHNNFTTYSTDPQWTWENSWNVTMLPWGNGSLNTLMTGMLCDMYLQFGGLEFAKGLYHQIPLRQPLSSNLDYQGARDNFYIAASIAANQNLNDYFTLTAKWTISQSAIDEVDATLNQLLTNPTLTENESYPNASFVKENFNYTASEDLNGQIGPQGFFSYWNQTQSSLSTAKIANGSLTYPGLTSSGNKLHFIDNGNNENVKFERQLGKGVGCSGTTAWFSYLIQPVNVGSGHCLVSFCLNDARTGKKWGNEFAIGNGPGGFSLQNGETYFVVTRYDFKDGADDVYLWINPSTTQEPEISNAYQSRSDIDASKSTEIFLDFQGYHGGEYFIDEISLSNNWNDIIAIPSNNHPPVVSLVDPSNGSVYSSGENVIITANASDIDGNLDRVDFYSNGLLIGSDNSQPFSISTTDFTVGNKTIVAVARDNEGAVSTSLSHNITITNTNQAPNISIDSPSEGQVFTTSTVVIDATANDIDGNVTQVEFFLDGVSIGVDFESPYTTSINNLSEGQYTISATATDNEGATKTTLTRQFSIDLPNTPPVVYITSPSNNSLFQEGQAVSITANANNEKEVTQVEFFSNGISLGSDTESPFELVTSSLSTGQNALTAIATDNEGAQTTSAVINIIIEAPNNAPVVSITSPSNNSTFTEGDEINILVDASDSDGNITLVEFFANGISLGTDNNSPYSFSTSNLEIGNYNITVIATDDEGASTTSAVVSLTVETQIVGCSIPAWSASAVYTAGKQCSKGGFYYKANWWNTNKDPETNSGQYLPWTLMGPCGGGGNQDPIISITTPVNNASFDEGNSFSINAEASDPDGNVTQVEFFINGNSIGVVQSSPYSVSSGNLPIGNHVITAEVTDNEGAKTLTGTVNIIVNTVIPNEAPQVALTAPNNQDQYTEGDLVIISANASDIDGTVTNVAFYANDQLIGSDNSSPYTISTSTLSPGLQSIYAVAMDNDGASTISSSIEITITDAPNQAPIVSITSPTSGTQLDEASSVTITANAIDIDGSIALVEFFIDGVKVGEDDIAPYNYNWSNLNIGSYSLTAIATDNENASTTSSTINVDVNEVIVGNCENPEWSSTAVYVAGNKASKNGVEYKANWWNTNSDPELNSGPWQTWTNLGPCGSPSQNILFKATLTNQKNQSTITIESDQASKINVEIFNSIGQVVDSKELWINENKISFDINTSNYSDGYYFIKINNYQEMKSLILIK